jgi:hypothetical protein
MDANDLFFQTSPEIGFAGNTFINCPTILRYEDTPLIEVVNVQGAGFSTQFSIYHNDGTKIAVVKGPRIFLTEQGKLAKLTLCHEAKVTVCVLENKPIFEIRRTSASGLKGWAELYATGGVFVKVSDTEAFVRSQGSDAMYIGGMIMQKNTFSGCNVGIHILKNAVILGSNTSG